MPHHGGQRGQGRAGFQRGQRLHLLRGEIRVSTAVAQGPPPGPTQTPHRPFIPRMVHALAVPIILFWVAMVVILSLFVPSLEIVGQERSVSLSPSDAPSFVALKHIGRVFDEGGTDSVAMLVLESVDTPGQPAKPLGDEAHTYYDNLIRKLRADKAHVLAIQDFWGDPLTAAGAQSNDG